MTVIEIQKMERGRYKIVTDDITFILYYKEMKALGIEAGKEVADDLWQRIEEILLLRGKKRVYHLLGRQDYTTSELYKKLSKDGYPENIGHHIVDYFIEKGFINDDEYLRKYYNYHKSKKSRRVIEMKLREKGITSDRIRDFFAEVPVAEVENETARQLLEKKYGHKTLTQDDYVKMVRFLSYKGFSYDICKSAVESFMDSCQN